MKMNNSKNDDIKWLDCRKKLSETQIFSVENQICINLPVSYISCIKNCNGGRPTKPCFEYYDIDLEETWTTGVGRFLSLSREKHDNFIECFLNPPEFFPKELIAFAETGGGDYICFDYREGKDNPDPPIVYWNHEADVGKDVSFVAKNFEEFLEILKEPEDE